MAAIPTVDADDALAILKAAEEWLSDPEHWTQELYWRNADDLSTDDRACVTKTCAEGALGLVSGAKRPFPPTGAREALATALVALGEEDKVTSGTILRVNDDNPDGYARIMAGLRKAIETLEAEARL
jgi:hypothetical protein